MSVDTVLERVQRLPRPLLWAMLWATVLLVAYINRFVQDDAFISFRYAQHLFEGHGLVWNIGETAPVEGYSNFLWVLLITLGYFFGLEPDTWSMFLGFACGVGTLWLTYKVARHSLESDTGSDAMAMLTMFLLGTNYTFAAYITGGLETQLQALLVIASFYLTFLITDSPDRPRIALLLLLSVVFAFAAMTRLDSVLLAGVAWAYSFIYLLRKGPTGSEKWAALAALLLPGLVLGLAWFGFKLNIYGQILPNTFFVKADTITLRGLMSGVWYIWGFLVEYGLVLLALLALLHFQFVLQNRYTILMMSVLVLWVAYLLKIGGDFMEFRQWVPVLPLLYILLVALLRTITDQVLRLALVAMLLLFSLTHGMTYFGRQGIQSVPELNAHVYTEGFDRSWKLVGEKFHELFTDEENPVMMSTTAAGAIPYYSRLPTVDMLGLNDRWTALNGMDIHAFAGHGRYSTLDYLLERGVNLMVGHPKTTHRKFSYKYTIEDMFHTTYFFGKYDVSQLPEDVKIIEIPIGVEHKIAVLYLRPHPAIDRAIKEYNLVTYVPER